MSLKALQEYTYYSKYARYNKNSKRRETWNEAVERVKGMHLKKYEKQIERHPEVEEQINWAFEQVKQKRVLGSQRALQFGGEPILRKNARLFNCTVSYCDRIRFFQEALWLLLCGCLPPNTKVLTETGPREIKDIHVNERVWSYNRFEEKYELKKVTATHDVFVPREENVKITGRFGNFTTSKKHPVLVYRDKAWIYVPARNLKLGDIIKKGYFNDNLDFNEKAYLAGSFLGDGCSNAFDIGSRRIRINGDNEAVINRFAEILSHISEEQVEYSKDTRGEYSVPMWKLEKTFSKESNLTKNWKEWVGNLPSRKAGVTKVPSWIKQSYSKSIFFSFLAGLIDTDGNVDEDDGKIFINTSSSFLKDDLLELCPLFGLYPWLTVVEPDTYNSTGFQPTMPHYRIIFSSLEFRKYRGFLAHDKKREKIERFVQGTKSQHKTLVVPIDQIEQEIKYLGLKKFPQSYNFKYQIQKHGACRAGYYFSRNKNYDHLQEYDQIIQIEDHLDIDPNFKDLTVESNHSYLCGEGSYYVLHNCGVGFSVQKHHVAKLPKLYDGFIVGNDKISSRGDKKFLIPDTIEGWADALGVLLASFLPHPQFPQYLGYTVNFDYSLIRPAGTSISSGVGKAPGPEPLRKSLELIRKVLLRCVMRGQSCLKPIDAYDIVMHSSDAVLSGGVRRCLDGNSKILVKNNSYKKIQDIKVGDLVVTNNGWKKVINKFDQGVQNTIKILHENGELICTPNHRIAILKSHKGDFEWKKASELKYGDRLVGLRMLDEGREATLPEFKYFPPKHSTTCKNISIPNLDEDIAWLIGIIQGDGYIRLKTNAGEISVAVEGDNFKQALKVKKALEKFNVSVQISSPKENDYSFRVRVKSKQLATFFYRFVKKPKTCLQIPEPIKKSSARIKGAYLQGLFDSDGSFKTRPQELMTNVYLNFLKEIQNLLFSLGIYSKIKNKNRNNPDWQPIYDIHLINNKDKKIFNEITSGIGFKRMKIGKISKLGNNFPMVFFENDKPKNWYKYYCSSAESICVDGFERLYGETNLVPIKVLEIKDHKKVQTFDIEVEDDHCFLCEGILVHNSATICLFSPDDKEMVNAKTGNWFEENPQRARSNNSALLLRDKTTKEEFMELIKSVQEFGEPGFVWGDNLEAIFNPSLRAGTKVLTDKGVFNIEELENSEFKVKNLYGHWEKANCHLSGINKELWKMDLIGGKSYYATEEHKWPIYDKKLKCFIKKETKELRAGDLLPIITENKLFDGDLGDFDDGFLAGWLYGDGWITKRKDNGKFQYGFVISYKDAEAGILEKLTSIIRKKTGMEAHWVKRKNCYENNFQRKALHDLFMKFGVGPKKNGFPKAIWKGGSEEFRKGFIDGLLSADGSVNRAWGSKVSEVVISTSKDKLANDFCELMGFYGIRTTRHQYVIDGRKRKFSNGKVYDKKYNINCIRIAGQDSLHHFAKTFSISHKEKLEKYNQYINDDLVPHQRFIKITNVQKTNIKENVWDISVYDKTHCFQLSNCITGNCVEIGFVAYDQFKNSGWHFCNLAEQNGKKIKLKEDWIIASKAGAIIGTLQAGYTDFSYLGPVTKRIVEREALLGVSITGMMDNPDILFDPKLQREMAQLILKVNEELAPKLGINKTARATCIKPAGCQKKDTLLVTNKGVLSLEEVGDIYGKKWQEHNHFVLGEQKYKKSSKFFVNGLSKTKKITLKSGLTLECTLNHKFKVLENGNLVWKEANDLVLNDLIPYQVGGYSKKNNPKLTTISLQTPNLKPIKQPEKLNSDLSWLLGLYLGDGSNHNKGIRISGDTRKPEILIKAKKIIEEQFGRQCQIVDDNREGNRQTLYFNSIEFVAWLGANGLKKEKSPNISFPEIIRRSSVDCIEAYIDGYWSADGSIHPINKTRNWVTTSQKMAQQLVVVLRAIGQDAAVRLMPPTKTSKTKRMRYWIQERKGRNGHYFKSPSSAGYKSLDQAGLYNLNPDYVLSIKDSNCYTYDIEVPEGNDYLANSYISHNTTSCALGTSSGVHPHHARRYFRRVQGNTMEAPLQYFKLHNEKAVEKSVWSANGTDEVITFCIEVEDGAKTKNDIDAVTLLEHVKSTQQNWVAAGKVKERCMEPWLTHNVSNTINVRSNEWDKVADFIYENRKYFAGISLLPQSGDLDYPQAPMVHVHTPRELIQNYGDGTLLASGLIVDGLHAFSDLWVACDYVLGIRKLEKPTLPETLDFRENTDYLEACEKHQQQEDWVRRVRQFADRYCDADVRKCTYLMKEVNNWKRWLDLNREYQDVDYTLMFEEEDNTKVMETIACTGGKCDI